MPWSRLFLTGLALLALAWGIDFVLHRAEREVLSRIGQALEAVEDENLDALLALIHPDFEFEGKSAWVGSGRQGLMREKLNRFWSQADEIFLVRPDGEVVIEAEEAKATFSGWAKFAHTSSGYRVVYHFDAEVNLVRQEGLWVIRKIFLPKLAPGIF